MAAVRPRLSNDCANTRWVRCTKLLVPDQVLGNATFDWLMLLA
jgi:hypothetical protein